MNKKAYWIHHTHFLCNDEYECSSCGNCADKPYRVCPFCGIEINGRKFDPFDVDEMEMLDEIFDV